MRHRKLPEISTLRRSPRFQKENPPIPEAPEPPKCAVRKSRVPFSDLTPPPLSSVTAGDSPDESQKFQGDVRSRNPKGSKKTSSRTEKSTGLKSHGAQGLPLPSIRRSSRLSQKASDEKTKEGPSSNGSRKKRDADSRSCHSIPVEKRVTRSSVRDSKNGGGREIVKGCYTLRKCRSAQDIGDKVKADRGGNSPGECLYRIEKRVTRSATWRIQALKNLECGDVQEVSNRGDAKFGKKLFREDVVEKQVVTASVGRECVGDKMRSSETEKKLTGTKRKRAQLREERLQSNGWTEEQEFALEKAYFTAKPTPRFWKKVAKMVPGKSAHECFNKIHSELMTPPQRQTQSRAKARISPFSLSPSKLLMSPVPETKKQKKSRFAHKTVRELLKKQCNSDQENSCDLFSVLEQTLDPPTQIENNRQLFTPERDVGTPLSDKRCMKRPSASRKHLSPVSNSCEDALASPLVLKKVKNKALHEKYIDQLHSREARRKAASLRAGKSVKGAYSSKQNPVQKMAAFKDAKNALIFCAKEAVNQFQHLQSSNLNQFEDGSDDFSNSSEHESEDGS